MKIQKKKLTNPYPIPGIESRDDMIKTTLCLICYAPFSFFILFKFDVICIQVYRSGVSFLSSGRFSPHKYFSPVKDNHSRKYDAVRYDL
jgi:hypothetical protein